MVRTLALRDATTQTRPKTKYMLYTNVCHVQTFHRVFFRRKIPVFAPLMATTMLLGGTKVGVILPTRIEITALYGTRRVFLKTVVRSVDVNWVATVKSSTTNGCLAVSIT